MYPDPLRRARRLRAHGAALREARLSLGVGQRPHHHASATCASCFPASRPTSTSCLTVLSFCAAATTTLKVGTALAVPADARSVLARQAGRHHRPALGRPADPGVWASAPIARSSPPGRRGSRPPRSAARCWTRARADAAACSPRRRVTHQGKYYAVPRRRDVSQAQAPNPFALWVGGHNMANDRARGAYRHRLAAGLAAVARARGAHQDR